MHYICSIFSTFFASLCPKSTKVKNRPYLTVIRAQKHKENSIYCLSYMLPKFTRCFETPGIYLSIKGFTKVRKYCHLHWLESCTDAIKKTHPRPRIFGQVDISLIMTRVIVEFNYLASLSRENFINFSFCKW